MIKDGVGGGNTVTGLAFENKVDFLTLIQQVPNYKVKKSATAGFDIIFGDDFVAKCLKKYEFYRFLEAKGIKWKKNYIGTTPPG